MLSARYPTFLLSPSSFVHNPIPRYHETEALASLEPYLSLLPITNKTIITPVVVEQIKQSIEDVRKAAEAYVGRKRAGRIRNEDKRKADWLDSQGELYRHLIHSELSTNQGRDCGTALFKLLGP